MILILALLITIINRLLIINSINIIRNYFTFDQYVLDIECFASTTGQLVKNNCSFLAKNMIMYIFLENVCQASEYRIATDMSSESCKLMLLKFPMHFQREMESWRGLQEAIPPDFVVRLMEVPTQAS